MHAAHPAVGVVRIGPNSIIQTVGALEDWYGVAAAHAMLARMGYAGLPEHLPSQKIDEAEFIAMLGALRAELGMEQASRILARSGERTADYVRLNRVPAPIRAILPWLPSRMGLRIFLRAISAHSWTFAGAGRFSFDVGGPGATLSLADCPECRGIVADQPICSYYRSCFESLLRPLIDQRLQVRELACAAQGHPTCQFEVRL
ncbi:MAG: bacteriochlorophyll 4-vinyl reductase [Oscillochloridaceae bacterium umkhey_bin13]